MNGYEKTEKGALVISPGLFYTALGHVVKVNLVTQRALKQELDF